MSKAMMLTKRGTTSWGQPWCATFGRAVVLMDKNNVRQAVFKMDIGDDPDYIETEIVDQSLVLTDEQLAEMLDIARNLKKWCKEIKAKAKKEAFPTAFLYLIAYYKKGIFKSTDEFFKSKYFRKIVNASIGAARVGLNATYKSDDYIFTRWVDINTNTPGYGAIFEEITNFVKYVAEVMMREGM